MRRRKNCQAEENRIVEQWAGTTVNPGNARSVDEREKGRQIEIGLSLNEERGHPSTGATIGGRNEESGR